MILSTPKCFIISRATAVEALPEIGLTNIRGRISPGIWRKRRTGERKDCIKSKIPEFLKALIAKNSPIRVGNILTTVSIPSLAPY